MAAKQKGQKNKQPSKQKRRKPIWGKRRLARRRKSNPRYRAWGKRPAHRARTLVRDGRTSAFDLIELNGDDLRRALTMRPSGLASSGHYKDHADYLIFCGGWNIGRIYEIRIRPEHLRWFWALHFPGRSRGVTGSGEGGIRGALAQVEGVGQ